MLKLVTVLSLLLASSAAHADGAPAAVNSGDTAWMLVSSALVLIMTPALAFFYGGMVRSKNAVATLMQSFIAIPVISIVWYLVGYSTAFAPGSSVLGGLDWSMLSGVGGAPNADYGATIPHALFATYQAMFAIITPALVTGAFAERMKFKSYLAFLVLWSLVVYSPAAHWVWAVGGLLRNDGVLDFAGGLVVHQTAGFSALAAALVLGKRVDYGKADVSSHNVPMVLTGTALLWMGWYGFNGGSAIGSGELSVSAFATTHFAASSATLAWMAMDWILKGKPSLVGACIGAVVGLVAVTPASGFVTIGSAVIIGLVAAVVSNLAAHRRARSGLDDSLDVFACHGLGGLVGALLTGLLASKAVNAAGNDGSLGLMFTQLKASVIVGGYSFIATIVILKAVGAVFGLRPTPQEELAGLDASEHGEKAYL